MKRDLNLDSLKGVLMIIVVYGHVSFSLFSVEKPPLLANISSYADFF